MRNKENIMPSTKEYKDYVLEQLRNADNISYRPMMGEFLLYKDGILFGGIYDDRLLVKITKNNKKYNMDIDYEKQYKEQRYRQMAINQSNMRFKNNYENKIKKSQSNWSNLTENGEVFIDEYINRIKEIHKDSNNYEAFKQRNEYFNFSSCPFCKGPAFFKFENSWASYAACRQIIIDLWASTNHCRRRPGPCRQTQTLQIRSQKMAPNCHANPSNRGQLQNRYLPP
jgi:TfoX/Sxy family transcriptional regulator of competence genes